MSQICAVLGGQWGDEGKGKLIDMLAPQYDIVVRVTGGANAGHSVYVDIDGKEKKIIFHLIPSGLIYKNKIGIIGNGCVVHLPTLFEEIETLKNEGIDVQDRLFISDRAHVLFEYHKEIDGLQEAQRKAGGVGTTRRGIGPCYTDKISRYGIRMVELIDFETFVCRYKEHVSLLERLYDTAFSFDQEKELKQLESHLPILKSMIIDASEYLYNARLTGKKILLEGANATLLDIDHGTYPFVTSSNPSAGGLFTGSGLAPRFLEEYIGIMKAYMTRVGGGPFPTELENEIGERLRNQGNEFGSTTGRPRRCGWFDLVASRYSCMINGFTSINLTKVDVLSGIRQLKVAVRYILDGKILSNFPAYRISQVEVDYETFDGFDEDISQVRSFSNLPSACQKYVLFLEEGLGCPIKYIGVGRKRGEMIVK